ncbi:leucine-rich repeat protein, partial [Skeletonema marinoi]
MNDATQQSEEEAYRRSGRERKQVISVYTEAKRAAVAAERGKAVNNHHSRSGRSTRSRKRKQEEESDDNGLDGDDEEDNYASSDDEDRQSDAASSEGEDDFIDDEGDTRVIPSTRSMYQWRLREGEQTNSYQSVDGGKIIGNYHCYFTGGQYTNLTWNARGALSTGQKALVSKQRKRSIKLERVFGHSSNLSQVPYHPDMLPCYEYFAQGIQRHTSLETFKIINYHLPPSSWLENNVLSTLENIHTLRALELSNCSVSADDLSSLVDYIADNKTLSTLNISHTNIESEDTAKALAKALKKHPAICNVNLAYCSLAGGSAIVDKILAACKSCDSLKIGHEDFDKESVALVAKFIGKKNSLSSFSLTGAAIDNDNKKLLTDALVKNKTIESLSLQSNKLQLPGIIRNTKKMTKSLSRLTRLDLSHNSLPLTGAKMMASFLESAECKLITLIMSNNHLTTKGANVLLPALKKNTTLQQLDLSRNWLNDQCVPAVVDMLRNNSTLLKFDLTGNKSLKTVKQRAVSRWGSRSTPHVDGGRAKIVKDALFDTTSLDSIAASNHTCALSMTGHNHNDSFEETIRRINALDASEGAKIRYKLVLALNHVNTDLYNPRSFDSIPLELMPCLFEMLQQGIGYNGFGKDIAPKTMPNLDTKKSSSRGTWNPLTRKREKASSKD